MRFCTTSRHSSRDFLLALPHGLKRLGLSVAVLIGRGGACRGGDRAAARPRFRAGGGGGAGARRDRHGADRGGSNPCVAVPDTDRHLSRRPARTRGRARAQRRRADREFADACAGAAAVRDRRPDPGRPAHRRPPRRRRPFELGAVDPAPRCANEGGHRPRALGGSHPQRHADLSGRRAPHIGGRDRHRRVTRLAVDLALVRRDRRIQLARRTHRRQRQHRQLHRGADWANAQGCARVSQARR